MQESQASERLDAGRTEMETPGAAVPGLFPVPIAVTAPPIAPGPKIAAFALAQIAPDAAIERMRLPIAAPHQDEEARLYAQE